MPQFPTFRPGMAISDIRAADLQALSDAARALSNITGTNGIEVTRTSSGVNISLVEPRGFAAPRMFAAAITRKIEDGDQFLDVRRVRYGVEPPQGDGTGPYIWVGDSFRAYPDYGKRVDAYKPFENDGLDMSAPPPTDAKFVQVRRAEHSHVVLLPSESGSAFIHAVIRWPATMTGLEQTLWVQEVKEDGLGTYEIVGDVLEARVVPGMLSLDYYSMKWMEDDWSFGANTVKVYTLNGVRFVEQTTKFTLPTIDPGYLVDDCWLGI